MSRVPLHLRNTTMAQVVLGPSCCDVQLSQFRDILDDDDREFFVQAWCWHPSFIERQKLIFVLEPPVLGVYVEPTSAPGLRYLVRTRLVAYQDWRTPPGSPGDAGNDGGGDDAAHDDASHGGEGANPSARGIDDYPPNDEDSSVRRDCHAVESPNSFCNRGHPRVGTRCGAVNFLSVIVGAICYPLGVAGFSIVPDMQPDLCLSSPSSTSPAFERWAPASPPRTPLHLSERRLLLSRAAETPSQLLLRGRSHQPTGLVGRFINIAPILLHGGAASRLRLRRLTMTGGFLVSNLSCCLRLPGSLPQALSLARPRGLQLFTATTSHKPSPSTGGRT
jgi:hypothetical protein